MHGGRKGRSLDKSGTYYHETEPRPAQKRNIPSCFFPKNNKLCLRFDVEMSQGQTSNNA